MEEAIERRDVYRPRMPLDEVLVELRHDGFDEAFEADGLNVGPGGISMRSSILPDVGTRLRCRFRAADESQEIDANAEVVWAHDNGPNLGEFGLRFTTISDTDQSSIEQMIERWQESIFDNEGPSDEKSMPGTVTLRLKGVAQPVVAELVHRGSDALIAEQRLPFLRIGTVVTDDMGKRGELQGVDLRLDGDVPKLVLTLWYDASNVGESTLDEVPGESLAEDDASMSDPEPAAELEPVVVAATIEHKERRDHSVVFEIPDDSAPGVEPVDASAAGDEIETAAAEFAPGARLAHLRTMLSARFSAGRVLAAVVWSRVAPFCLSLMRKGVSHGRRLALRVRPLAHAMLARVRRRGTTRPARRQTRAPRRATTRPEGKAKPVEPERPAPNRRRAVALLALLAGGLGTGYAVLSDDDVAEAEQPPSVEPPVPEPEAPPPVLAAPPAAPEPAAVEPAPPPAPSPPPTPAEVVVPRALPEPPREAGRMPEPEFPTLSGRAPVPVGAMSFGADRVSGAEFQIPMSTPVRRLGGERTDRGFVVHVEGARALEGARRISSTLAHVERASIVNQDDGAVLTVRFVGRVPAYRVEAAGQILKITIAE